MRPPHLEHSTASSQLLKSAVWPVGAAACDAGSAPPPGSLGWCEPCLHLWREDPGLLLLVGGEELLAHPAEDVVDDRLGDPDVRVVRHPARLEAHVAELRDVHLERHAVLQA